MPVRRAPAVGRHLEAAGGPAVVAGRRRTSADSTSTWAPNRSAISAMSSGRAIAAVLTPDLVGAGAQQAVDVVDGAHSPADGERDEDLLGGAPHDVVHRLAVAAARRDVEEGQLVDALRVVDLGELDRVAGVTEVLEVDALDDPAGVDVEAGDDPGGDRHATKSRPALDGAARVGSPPCGTSLTDPAREPGRPGRRRRSRAAAEPPLGTTVVVAIDGPSGSGKTPLAKGVAAALEAAGCPVVHLDDSSPGWDGLAAEAPGRDHAGARADREGQPAAYRTWSWVRDEWHGTHSVAPSRFLVVEGCGAASCPPGRMPPCASSSRPTVSCGCARLARDGEAYRPHWERWAAQEARLYAADGTRQRADLVIDTSSL